MTSAGTLLGLDIGSSSIKASLLDVASGKVLVSVSSPEGRELEISSPQPGFAEQSPELWWQNVKKAIQQIRAKNSAALQSTRAIGISYQMHGLVLMDAEDRVLRPAIIWCDSRAVKIGEKAFHDIGPEKCLSRLLNSPGNFTASKLRWVKENQPEIFRRVRHYFLPGDYIAFCLSGQVATTASGLSEGISWDFEAESPAFSLLKQYEISTDLIPPLVPTFGVQARVSADIGAELGLPGGTPISYRAGDQPNNALSLNVLNPGEVAATAGTSGVIVGIGADRKYDPFSRVNTFLHVNHRKENPRYCTLLCINGTGIMNSWARRILSGCNSNPETQLPSYEYLNQQAATVPVGSDGLLVLPFGNGAERSLQNKNLGASILGLDLNRHQQAHIFRAVQEGIVCSMVYGLEIMRQVGVTASVVRAGLSNMFLSPIFRQTFANMSGATIEMFETDGAVGAARGAGIGAGIYCDSQAAFAGFSPILRVEPEKQHQASYHELYARWNSCLKRQL